MGQDPAVFVGDGDIEDAGLVGGLLQQVLQADLRAEPAAHAGTCSGLEGLDERRAFFLQKLRHVLLFPTDVEDGHDRHHRGQDAGRAEHEQRGGSAAKEPSLDIGKHAFLPVSAGPAALDRKDAPCRLIIRRLSQAV